MYKCKDFYGGDGFSLNHEIHIPKYSFNCQTEEIGGVYSNPGGAIGGIGSVVTQSRFTRKRTPIKV